VAYDDLPEVDASLERSEESVRAVLSVLTLKAGFACREDRPDLGVDFQVELIRSGGATNCRFVVQIKSAAKLSMISKNGEKFISHTFLTSRIAYICRHIPGYGLIALYDDHDGILYFDFIERIVERLSGDKPPSEWKAQESVNIHVPITRILDAAAAREIHETMTTRFENASVLIAAKGAEYGLPILALQSVEGKLDLRNPLKIAEFLNDFGATLFNRRDFEFLLDLIERLPNREIEQSSELGFIVALAYAKSGRHIDAEYYIRKALSHSEKLSTEKSALLSLATSEIDFRFGRIDSLQYLSRVKELYPLFELKSNQLGVRLRIDHLEIIGSMMKWELGAEDRLLAQLETTESEIRAAPIEEQARRILLLYLAGERYQLGLNLFAHDATRYRIRARTVGEEPLAKRIVQAQRVLRILESAIGIVQEVANGIREDPEQKALQAHVYYRLASMFFSFAMNDLMLGGNSNPTKQQRELYQLKYQQAISAYNFFVEKQDLDEAFSALSTAYEIRAIHNYVFDEKIEIPPKEQLLDRLSQLSSKTRHGPFESIIDTYLNETLPRQEALKDKRDFSDLSPEQIDRFARTFAAAHDLPEERIQNIIADVMAVKRFDEAIANPNAALLQNLKHSISTATMYAVPMLYAGRCMECGFLTADSQDVDVVIAEYLSAHGS
jgi:hypothetical protein